MKGYVYNTEQEAVEARKKAADYKGLPIKENYTTKYWVNYEYSKPDNLWYIVYDDGLEAVLGEPIDLELTINY